MTFTLLNCKIRVDFLFFAMLCVTSLTDESAMTAWGLAAAALHECAHLAAMKTAGIGVKAINVRCCGMEIKAQDENAGMMHRLLCAGAGIAMNLLLAVTGLLADFERFAAANLAMGLLSAVPVSPLDGGAMVKILAERLWGADRADVICMVCSLISCVPLSVAALVLAMRSRYNCSLLTLSVCALASIFEDMLS